jgi:two-component system, LytTR family, sensor kinase
LTLLNILNKRISRHIIFWLSYVVFFGLVYGKYENNYTWYFLESACMLPFIMFATYMTIYVFLPYYFRKRNAPVSFLFLIITLFIATLGERICLRILNSLPITFKELFSVVFIYLFLETNFMVGSAVAIKLLTKWVDEQKTKHEAEKQNLKSELNILKAQLNPHFLFNTMNNLYALSVEKSSKTSEGIAKISDLLRSVLYECDEAEFELSKEIKLIDNFIELEKMRYSDRLDISFEKTGNPEGFKIAPMMLFTFVENCFKHGCSPDPGNSWIKLNLISDNNKIIFEARNSKPAEEFQNSKNENQGVKGIGLNNVRKRLEILYENHYTLSITEDKKSYKLDLEIRR